jgi:hypothetical protein
LAVQHILDSFDDFVTMPWLGCDEIQNKPAQVALFEWPIRSSPTSAMAQFVPIPAVVAATSPLPVIAKHGAFSFLDDGSKSC